jgi:hypothetical protein
MKRLGSIARLLVLVARVWRGLRGRAVLLQGACSLMQVLVVEVKHAFEPQRECCDEVCGQQRPAAGAGGSCAAWEGGC